MPMAINWSLGIAALVPERFRLVLVVFFFMVVPRFFIIVVLFLVRTFLAVVRFFLGAAGLVSGVVVGVVVSDGAASGEAGVDSVGCGSSLAAGDAWAVLVGSVGGIMLAIAAVGIQRATNAAIKLFRYI
jgi:hypothetical protein